MLYTSAWPCVLHWLAVSLGSDPALLLATLLRSANAGMAVASRRHLQALPELQGLKELLKTEDIGLAQSHLSKQDLL